MNRIIVDTSIWIDHLHKREVNLVKLLDDDAVACHPFIIGEIACGSIRDRAVFLELLQALPILQIVEPHELLHFIERNHIPGSGIGLVDVHLLATCRLHNCRIWTKDKKLLVLASKLHLAISF